MCAIIGSFNFEDILQALPLLNARGGTAWSLSIIYTDFKVSSTHEVYHGDGKPTQEILKNYKKLPQELSHLQMNLRYREGQQVFPVASRMKVYYILHTQIATSSNSGQHPNTIEDEVIGTSLFWHNGIITSAQMKEWDCQGQFDSAVLHHRLQQGIYQQPFSVNKVKVVDTWKQIKGTLAFFCYIRGRILFGRNVSGPLYRAGTTISTVKSRKDMVAVSSGQILGIKDMHTVETLFTFEDSSDYI